MDERRIKLKLNCCFWCEDLTCEMDGYCDKLERYINDHTWGEEEDDNEDDD